MTFCSKCGTEIPGGAGFCPKCGEAQPGGGAAVPATQSAQPGMSENVAALLAYVLGWITGIIFLLIDKRPFVRFHAAQSIVVFGGLHLLNFAITIMFGAGMLVMGGFGSFWIGRALVGLVSLVTFVLWIMLMIKAYQHEKFEVPIAAGIAKSLTGNK